MTKALLLLAWVPLLSGSASQPLETEYPVTISCNVAWELMDIVKNDDVVHEKIEDRLLLELRKDVLTKC